MRQRPSRRSASSSARNVPDAPPPTITISRCDMRGRRLKLVLRETNRRSTLCPRHDVDAVAVLVDHARDAAHLAFDAAQPFRAGCLDVVSHAGYIPLHGIGFN